MLSASYSLLSTSSSSLLASESDVIASGPTGGRRKNPDVDEEIWSISDKGVKR